MEKVLDGTARAIEKIKEITKGNKFFRVTVKAGGCAGYKYDFSLEDEVKESDMVISDLILLDKDIAFLLNDSILDYVEDPFSSKFIITGTSTKSCGCGKSFG